jgi:protein tyrosine phosphatase (PTP) superfamily phosphohydrolase (DUF442 family)
MHLMRRGSILELVRNQYMKLSAMSEIRSFHAINDKLGTAGQPTREQFQSISEAGFEAIINLALPTSDNAIPDEENIVTSLGMAYYPIPVDFQAPQDQDLEMFCQLMQAYADRKLFVHCAANMRVSAFVFLYRVVCQGVGVAEAEVDLHAIWQPDEVWSRFIEEQL